MRYPVRVVQTPQGWHAAFPDIPDCAVDGASEGEVVDRAAAALAQRLRAGLAQGAAPAPPRSPTRAQAISVPHDIAFAIDLRDARRRAALSRSDLALRAGVPLELVHDLEVALTPPTLDKVIPIANALGVRPVIELERPAEAAGLSLRRAGRSYAPSPARAHDGGRRGPGAASSPRTPGAPDSAAAMREARRPRAERQRPAQAEPAPSAPRAEGARARVIREDVQTLRVASGDEGRPEETRDVKTLAHDWPSLDVLSLRYIAAVIERSEGNKSRAADALGIDRRTLNRILTRQRAKLGAPARSRSVTET
jgi:predicted RNase H-like HicB family nuclease/transcriptional regulator with XRE-family HTH domain